MEKNNNKVSVSNNRNKALCFNGKVNGNIPCSGCINCNNYMYTMWRDKQFKTNNKK